MGARARSGVGGRYPGREEGGAGGGQGGNGVRVGPSRSVQG